MSLFDAQNDKNHYHAAIGIEPGDSLGNISP
jgi:hypothetical protein